MFALVLLSLTAQTPLPFKPCARPAAEAERRAPARQRKLGEMPPAKQLLGVVRAFDGCHSPVVVKGSVGMPGR